MRTRIIGALVSGIALSVAAALPAAASAPTLHFRYQTFDVPGATGTQINGINDAGVFEGAYTDSSGQHGFVEDHGRLVRFDYPGTSGVTQAFAIDNSGAVLGVYTDQAEVVHGFLRSPSGIFTALQAPPGAGTGAGQGNFPTGITDGGEIVGFYIAADGVAHGYLMSPDGRLTVLDAPGAGTAAGQGTFIFSVNDRGVVGGAFVTSTNTEDGLVDQNGHLSVVIDPSSPPGPAGGTIADGEARGALVGDFLNQQLSERGFVQVGGTFLTVAAPGGNDAPNEGTVITATNDQLVLAGFYYTSGGVADGLIAIPVGG